MRAVFIDSTAKIVTDVTYDGNYETIYQWIGNRCRAFEMVGCGSGDGAFVDEEGMLKVDDSTRFFTIDGYGPLAGNALIIGGDDETGESCDVAHDAEHYRSKVKFMSIDAVRLSHMLDRGGLPY